jgi:two-component system, cell cycle sensor histidine kinase and response regulator CckA
MGAQDRSSFDVGDLLNRLEESVTIYDRDARLLYLNYAGARLFARPVHELIGQRPWDLVPSGDGPKSPFRVALESVLAGGPATHATSYVTPWQRWFDVNVYPHPAGAFATSRDITATKNAIDQLSKSEARFRAMVEFAPEAIVILDVSTVKIVDANQAAAKLLGRSRDELLQIDPIVLLAPTQPGTPSPIVRLEDSLRRASSGEIVDGEWAVLREDGKALDVEVCARLLPDTAPPLLRISIFDVTARKHAQERLAEVQKLEAVARLAGGVAHDFNNLLTVIIGGTQLALAGLPPIHIVRDDMQNVMSAAERASLVTKQLLAFGRKQPTSPRVVDLTAYVEGCQPVLQRLVGEDVEVVLDVARPLGGVLIDPAEVEQIVINLVANARDAMPRGGRLSIHTANVLLDSEYERLHNGVPHGRYVMLSVADTGMGIPDAVKAHIFEPFFTTKSLELGTGLGLATVHGIVSHNGGYIWVYSEPGMGATFKVYLPLVENDACPDLSSIVEPTKRFSGSETVLLVEDEASVRAFLRRALQRGGYSVLEASNAGEALLLCEQHGGPIELMITDVIMPRMTGPQLAARLRATRNEMRIVHISGYSEERLDAPGVASAHDGFIAKPMSVDVLLGTVRRVLDREA